jgi:endonuclease-3
LHNFSKVFKVFEKNYKTIPLGAFGKDPYKNLISVLLSSRTLDSTTYKSAKRLFKKAPTLKHLNNLREETIRRLIYPVGFYKTKAKQLKNLSKIIEEQFQGKIPVTRESLMKLPGVGRKTANLVLNRAFAKPAIAVDTHVHKISNLVGWVKTNTPEQTEKALEKILPKKYWADVNRLLVSIGQQYRGKKLTQFLKENKLL